MSLLLLFNPQTLGHRRGWASAPPSRLTVYGRGWTAPQPLPVSGIVATWAVESPGSLSCFVPAATIHRLGDDDWIGRWVTYDHPTQGRWAGIIQDEPGTIDDQTVELSCIDMRGLLMGRRLPVLYRVDTAHAGALARRALSDPTTTDPLPFTAVLADEVGRPIETEWRGDDTYDLFAALANQSGQEWEVVVDDALGITLHWRERLGRDKRDTVLIREGAHVTGGRIDRSLTTIQNDIAGVAADATYERSSYHQGERADAIARFGRRQAPIRRYEGVVTESTVRGKVQADLDREAAGFYLPTITLPALHPVCHEIRHGDTIRYWSAAKNRELDLRVMSRTVRDGTILALAGEAVEVRTPPRGRSFTPDLLSGLVAWYDADDASTVTILDGGVWIVADKSNEGHDLTAAELAGSVLAPAYRPNTLNGRAVVDNDDQQEGIQRKTVDFSATDAMTVYVVARETDTGGTSPVISFGDLTGAAPGQWEIGRDASDNITATLRGDVGLADHESGTAWGTADFRVVTAVFDMSLATNEVSLWVDGVAATTRNSNSDNTGVFDSSDTLAIPFTTVSVHNLWQWAEILIFDRAHDATQRAAVWSYLDRWGV